MTEQRSRPAVSVVIPTYNHARLLAEALRSVIAQTRKDWEAVVINNFSQDDTVAVVEGFRDSRIRLVNFRNHGIIAASRNEGVRQARADLISFLDSDDRWYARKLERCLAALGSGTDLVCHGEAWTRDGTPYRDVSYGPASMAGYRELLFTGNCLSTSAVVMRRSSFEQAGGFREDPDIVTAEDYDLWLTLARNGCRFAFLDEILGEYRLHAGNESRAVRRHTQAVLSVIGIHAAALTDHQSSDERRLRRRRSLLYADAAYRSLLGGNLRDLLSFSLRALSADPRLPFSLPARGLRYAADRLRSGSKRPSQGGR